ncbi:hypothetical protein [Nonomuraea diastatica]|uniref:Integral membrane protein n=1 Tax=Nonomuraea diastatica TaxID=1848329 RepID=A0A4R4WG59_9ACTN|nr:hypothetical protein [Nonomuraea diastatica]TDD14455.1 hypothetical protein E1294_37565 [Nonomuraea diastatica]
MTASRALADPPAHASGYLRTLRAVVVVHVVALLFQAVTAGMLLSSPGGRALHETSGTVLAAIGLVHLVAAILVWRPGGGPSGFIVPAALLLAFTVVAAVLGMMHVKTVHLPVGVLLFGAGVLQLTRVMPRRTP